ncbi:hypothetical protein PFISCL1PPCAC_18686 [Pristionchus fissidentatus]|uniref:G protein-coupled receptor n=1 Tax=Pristionchus fissidentatus TaxID=1538716 RepID=A0AAV5W9G8_9BILA|nr:hypothetical protein PFISCL1PPCAC_18686 [Pristionchus fissidentatus]
MELDFPEYSTKIAAIVSHSLIISIGLFSNILLMYAIVRYTPASFKKYSSLLFLTALTDTLGVVCDAFLIQRIMPTPIIIAQVWHESCYTIFSVYLHTMTYSGSLMVISFWYRYAVLMHNYPPRPSKLITIILILYLPSFAQMVLL